MKTEDVEEFARIYVRTRNADEVRGMNLAANYLLSSKQIFTLCVNITRAREELRKEEEGLSCDGT